MSTVLQPAADQDRLRDPVAEAEMLPALLVPLLQGGGVLLADEFHAGYGRCLLVTHLQLLLQFLGVVRGQEEHGVDATGGEGW